MCSLCLRTMAQGRRSHTWAFQVRSTGLTKRHEQGSSLHGHVEHNHNAGMKPWPYGTDAYTMLHGRPGRTAAVHSPLPRRIRSTIGLMPRWLAVAGCERRGAGEGLGAAASARHSRTTGPTTAPNSYGLAPVGTRVVDMSDQGMPPPLCAMNVQYLLRLAARRWTWAFWFPGSCKDR